MALKTPGVYINEINAFPNSVVAVATSIPVFIGYTEKAESNGKSLFKQPVAINSLPDFELFFGKQPAMKYDLQAAEVNASDVVLDNKGFNLIPQAELYLYNSMRLFYANGGGQCYVISLDSYVNRLSKTPVLADFTGIFPVLQDMPDITMLVFPDALALGNDYYTFASQAIDLCGQMQNCIALVDVLYTRDNNYDNAINEFRKNVQSSFLNYGAAYFPWLNTTVVLSGEVDVASVNDYSACIKSEGDLTALQNALRANMNCLPPSAAMAGVMTAVDNAQGVWKAPANVALVNVSSPVVKINDQEQQTLNVDILSGKSINALRSFPTQGVLVWGARTLEGNSQDWRYINVRRTMIMIEQSIKLAARAYVFEANDANTWTNLKSSLENFLNGLWQQGALAGAKPEEAYTVSVGLGTTMTAQDILNGYMIVNVLVAIAHPAEFIAITFQQQMQQS
ncbi:MAG: phage tail sheath family protein [Flavobacteriales bacterium]